MINNSELSMDKATNFMHNYTKKEGIDTVFERFKLQQPQCSFGIQGICCTNCVNGPCRITNKAKFGVCGATRDVIVARNFLRKVAAGTACYVYISENSAIALKETGNGRAPYKIKDEKKLKKVAEKVGIETSSQIYDIAIDFADFILQDIYKPSREPLEIVEAYAPKKRVKIWKELGIIPGGAKSEVFDAMVKSSTHLNSDPMDLLMHTLRLGIANGYLGLLAIDIMNDILLGTPKITQSNAGMGIVSAENVNISVTGHQPLLASKLIELATKKEFLDKANQVGAKGIKIIGTTCNGQELEARSKYFKFKSFAGQSGNWITTEFLLATGAIDLNVMDFNCSIPALNNLALRTNTKLVSIDKVVKMDGVEYIEFAPEKAEEIAKELILKAIESHKNKKEKKIDTVIPTEKAKSIVGFSVESLVEAMGGSMYPLLNAITNGAIKGIVAIVGCTNVKSGHDKITVPLAKELIKRDILVVTAGCTSSALENVHLMDLYAYNQAGDGLKEVCKALGVPPCLNFGACLSIGRIEEAVSAIADALNVDTSELPVVASAPQYLEEQALPDAIFATSLGLLTHVAPAPPVTGSELVAKTLTKDLEKLIGGRILIEEDYIKAANLIEEHIINKRVALGLK